MSWLSTLPALLVAVAVVLLPGAAVAWFLGFRRSSLLGFAPLFSLSIAGVAAVIAPLAGINWNVWVIVAATVLVSAAAYAASRTAWVRRQVPAAEPRDSWTVLGATAAAIAVGGFLTARRVIQLVGAPDNISQRYDNVFHLNAVRFVLDTGNASSLNLGSMAGGTGGLSSVYPAEWHSLAALVTQMTGAAVPVSVNVVNLVASAVIWPISVVFLMRVVAGPRPIGLLAAGIASAGLMAFPYLLLVWGPLFPNLLSVSALPAGIAAVILVCRLAPTLQEPTVRAWPALVLGMPGLALSHMSAVNALLAFSAPILVWKLVLHVRGLIRSKASIARFGIAAGVTVAGLVVAYVAWEKLRPAAYSGWTPHQTVAGSIGEVLANAPLKTDVAVAISLLAVIGIVRIIRQRTQVWLLGCYLVAGFLYVVDAGFKAGWARAFFTGTWYQDTNRLAAYVPIFAVVLAAVGMLAVADVAKSAFGGIVSKLPRSTAAGARTTAVAGLAGTVIAGVVLTWATQTGPVRDYVASGQVFYERDTKDSILSSDEYALLDRIDAQVPEDAVIAVNPWNGGALAYAFADRKVLEFHMSQPETKSMRVVAESLAEAGTSAAVCDAVRETKVSYALDFGTQYLLNHPESKTFPGLQNLTSSNAVELVDQQGDAKLFKVVACS
ncbi:DUF6541 family protein [Arthrobacter sp. ZGTC131]|uniref:DUF6541 family protein n=1 Tax=Arthrobacter sp. ZGTC131 TaxID=2058898 RepID=UPI000CE4944A|nr:DUF6541 family protein [Arthrobacter sp. ZGTC131]